MEGSELKNENERCKHESHGSIALMKVRKTVEWTYGEPISHSRVESGAEGEPRVGKARLEYSTKRDTGKCLSLNLRVCVVLGVVKCVEGD